MEGQKIVNEIDLGNGYSFLMFEDGTGAIVKVASELTEDLVAEIAEAVAGKKAEKPAKKEEKKPVKEEKKPVKEDDEDVEPEEGSYSWQDLKDMDEEELIELIKENDLDTDPDDFEDNEAGLRKAIAKEIGVEVPKKK